MNQSIYLKRIFILTIICFLGFQVQAQDKDKNKNISLEVQGNCGMCKERIDKAALKVKGVKYANWDIPTKTISLVIDENKCTPLEIQKAIAAVGHDTDLETAPDEIYNALPPCCQFRDPNSINMDHGTGH